MPECGIHSAQGGREHGPSCHGRCAMAPPLSALSKHRLLSVCSCRSILGHPVGFRLAEEELPQAKYLFKDRRPSPSLRGTRFVGLTSESAVLRAGKCSTWAFLSPPLQVPAGAGRLQFPACSRKGRRPGVGSST